MTKIKPHAVNDAFDSGRKTYDCRKTEIVIVIMTVDLFAVVLFGYFVNSTFVTNISEAFQQTTGVFCKTKWRNGEIPFEQFVTQSASW